MKDKITEKLIREYLRTIGVPMMGITKPFNEPTLTNQLIKHQDEKRYIYFGEVTIEQRQEVEAVFPLCKEIVVIGIPYGCRNENEELVPQERRAFVSNMAWVFDYHQVVKEKLELLAQYMKEVAPSLNYLPQVDTGPLIDRHIGYRSGIGNYAKNQCLMNPAYGTEFYIGYLLLDKELIGKGESSLPLHASSCQTCNRCVQACPGQALSEAFTFEGTRCISYLTQKKEDLTWTERELIGNSIYGCDRCQLVCPENANKQPIDELYRRDIKNSIDLIDFLKMSNKQLMRTYKASGFAWRGAKILKRNAIIALGNKKDEKNVTFLNEQLFNENEYHRPYILWALYRSGDPAIVENCLKTMEKYQDERTKNECKAILQIVK